jgi:Kef-type K+ transport system membrane component KefB
MGLLAVDFPPDSAEWTFFVAALVFVAGPVLAERLRLPGIVGVILGGLIVGPYVLDWVQREGIVESLGDLGILYLMFLAGLELDLDEFQAHRRSAVTFGGLTFSIPFGLGLLLAIAFGYGFATAALYGSLWASHTLLSYPIVQEHGLTRHRAVGMATGGTVMTDTLALSVLAIVAGSTGSDERPGVILLKIVLGLVVLAVFCAFVLTRLTRWVFAGLGQQTTARFVFLLLALTSAALVSERFGLEGIIGAFFAGLSLNRLVPARSQLMERVEFMGAALLIPFFLLSTGMLVDPEQFTHVRVLGIAALSLGVVVVGKGSAAYLSGRISHLGAEEVRLVFGLTVAQAAATLAAVTVGAQIGIFGEDLLSAAIVVVLVSVLIAGIATRKAARAIEPPEVSATPLASAVFVPVEDVFDPALVRLAARFALAKGGTVIVGTVAAPSDRSELDEARQLVRTAAAEAEAVGAEATPFVRVDPSPRDGLAAIAAEHDASLVVLGWQPAVFGSELLLVGAAGELASLIDIPLLLTVSGKDGFERVLLALDEGDVRPSSSTELELAVAVTQLAQAAARGDTVVVAATEEDARSVAERVGGAQPLAGPRVGTVGSTARQGDLVVIPSRPGRAALHRDAAKIAELPIGCAVAVALRARAVQGVVTGSPLVLGARSRRAA